MRKQTGDGVIMQADKRMIWVKFGKEGIHKYPALEDPNQQQVMNMMFPLGYPHRYLLKVEIEVFLTTEILNLSNLNVG